MDRRWPNAEVPYLISNRYTKEERAMLALSMQAISNSTCLRFVAKRTEHLDYLWFATGGNGCYATISYQRGKGPHLVHLKSPNCTMV